MSHPRFSIKRSSHDHFVFNLTAANGEIILSSQRYTSHQGAKDGIESVKRNAGIEERYDRRVSRHQDQYFVLMASNGEIIGTSEMYSSPAACDAGIEVVKRTAHVAPIEG